MVLNATDKIKLKNAFHKIFNSYDPFEPLIENRFSVKAVIYPTDGYFLSELQFKALSKTLAELKESSIIVSEIETSPYNPFTKDRHWILSDFDYREYDSLPLVVESAVYSKTGNWGFLLSHEDHALLLCDDRFSQLYQRYYQFFDKDLKAFTKYWQKVKSDGTKTDWLPKLLDSLTITT